MNFEYSNLFLILSSKKIKFKLKHQQYDVIILDESFSELISKYILRGIKCFIFKQRPEVYEFDIMSAIRTILFFFPLLFNNNCNFQSIGTLIRCEIIKSINPKIIITMIDNQVKLYNISLRLPTIACIQIQNALRTNWELKRNKIKPVYYYALGNDTIRKFKKIQPNQAPFKFKSAGSLRLSIAKTLDCFNSVKLKYDILYISQLSDNIINNKNGDFFLPQKKLMKSFSLYVKQYCNDKKIGILLRTNSELENEVFKLYFKKEDIINRDTSDPLISFSYLKSSRLVIGWFSTLLFEAASMGVKILRIDYSENKNTFNDYEKFVLFNPSNGELFYTLNKLIGISKDEYIHKNRKYINEIVDHRKTHELIHNDISFYIKNNRFNDDWLSSELH